MLQAGGTLVLGTAVWVAGMEQGEPQRYRRLLGEGMAGRMAAAPSQEGMPQRMAVPSPGGMAARMAAVHLRCLCRSS